MRHGWSFNIWLWFAPLLLLCRCNCEPERFNDTVGTLRVIVTNPPQTTPTIEVTAVPNGASTRMASTTTVYPETSLDLPGLEAGAWQVRIVALDSRGVPLNALWISDVFIRGGETTVVVVDMANGIPISGEICDGRDNDLDGRVDEPLEMPLCTSCTSGFEQTLADDARCGPISCAGFNRRELRGDNTATGTSSCVQLSHPDLTMARCEERGRCVTATAARCGVPQETILATAGLCKIITGCEAGTPTVDNVMDGISCGVDRACLAGECVAVCSPANVAVCHACTNNVATVTADDARCGTVDCDGLDHFEDRGDNTPSGASKSCVHVDHADLTTNRCDTTGTCHPANGSACTNPTESTTVTAGVCRTITGCVTGNPVVNTAPDGTPCGAALTCQGGNCLGAPVNNVGCSDNTREGFQSQATHPNIAGCSGGFGVGGVTRANLVATCNRASGNTGSNPEGTGCSAADLCANGWHVCNGKTEVAQKAPSGCADAVPGGTPDKALFFAVAQHSTNNSQCDDASMDTNDVFGCGNLGVMLDAAKMCGPLTRVLASTQANSCGYNEAEPSLGPWQCLGGAQSHLQEGTLVTKVGCPNTSCSYSGSPIGNSDKGGVLCCRD